MKCNSFYLGFALSVISMLLVSCDAEFVQETTVVIGDKTDSSLSDFHASMDDSFSYQSERTAISTSPGADGTYSLRWESGDEISISEGNNTAVYATNGIGNTAKFSKKSGYISNTATKYVAFFPASLTPKNQMLPATQEYVAGNVKNYPMYAESYDKNLSFKNLCGILRLSLTNTEVSRQISVKSVSVSVEGRGLSGRFTMDASRAAVVSGNDGVVLNCATPVTLGTGTRDFNIVVPKGIYYAMKIKITAQDGKVIYLEGKSAVCINRSGITKVNITLKADNFNNALEVITFTESDVEFSER